MVAPVIAGLSRVVVAFARSPSGKQFLKLLKDAGKSPAEREALLTEQVQKSFRDSPGIRQRLIALEQGDIKELSKAEILAKKIADRKAGKKEDPWDFVQRTGDKPKPNEEVVKWDSLKGSGYIHEPVPVKGVSGPRERKFNLTSKGKKALQKAIDDGIVGQLDKPTQMQIAKLIDQGKLKSRSIAPTAGKIGTRTAETQLGLFPGEQTVIGTAPKVISEKAPVSATKANMLRKSIQDTDQQIEKLKAQLESAYDNKLSDDVKYNITQQLEKAYAKADKFKNEATSLKQQGKLFGEKVGDEFSEASAVAGAKRHLERERLKRKRMQEVWTKEKELKTIEENAAAVRADIQRDPRRLPKDVYKKPYNPQEYGFEGYNPGWKGEPSVGVEKVYRGSGKTLERKGYVTPKPHETMSGTGRTELPEYTLESRKPYGVPEIPGAQGAAPAFAKELTGRQTRRSMGAITPADDILAGVPYKLNPTGELKYAYPKTGDIQTSTFIKKTEWDLATGKVKKIPKPITAPDGRRIKNPDYGQPDIQWTGRRGNPHNRVNSRTGLTVDEFHSLSDAQKNELNRRLQLAKAGGARISEPATGYKIPPELTQTGMTQAEYAGVKDQLRPGGMGQWQLAKQLDRVDKRIAGQAPTAGRLDKTGRKTILGDGTEMNTADFRKLPPMERLGMLDKSFATASPKGQGFKSLTKQQERLDEIKKPKEWWNTGQPHKPMDYTKSYRGETKSQALRKAKQAKEEFKKIALEFSPEEYAKLKPTEIASIRSFIRFHPEGVKQGAKALSEDIAQLASHMSRPDAIKLLLRTGHLKPHPRKTAPFKKGGPVDENWIQKVRSRIQKKGTEGVCTGKKYGSSSCPPGSKRYNLATTFRNMNRKRA